MFFTDCLGFVQPVVKVRKDEDKQQFDAVLCTKTYKLHGDVNCRTDGC